MNYFAFILHGEREKLVGRVREDRERGTETETEREGEEEGGEGKRYRQRDGERHDKTKKCKNAVQS